MIVLRQVPSTNETEYTFTPIAVSSQFAPIRGSHVAVEPGMSP